MTTLRKVLPFTLLAMVALWIFTGHPSPIHPQVAYAQTPDCSFTFKFTGVATQTAVSNLSGGTPCVNWRLTLSTTGSLSATVTFYTSPDNSTWTAVPNTVCSSTVQPPCVLQGANPMVGTQGMLYAASYGSYVRVVVSSPSGAGTGTVRGYGAKGASATSLPAGGGGGGGSGTVTNVATTGPITGGPITATGTIGLDTTKVAQKFFGTAAPGSVATNLPGDLFTDTTAHNEYVCNAPSGTAAPACTAVTAAGWLLVNGGGGGSGTVTNVATTGPITGGPITNTGTIGLDVTKVAQKFFGTAAPGSVATNLPGDLFTDTTAHNEYVCNAPSGTAAPACTSVTAAGWLLLNGGSGSAIGLLLSGAVDPGVPSITLRQSAQVSTENGNSLAYPSAVVAGNLLVAVLARSASNVSVIGVTGDTLGNSWTKDEQWTAFNGIQVWHTISAFSGANTLNAQNLGADGGQIIVAEFTGNVTGTADATGGAAAPPALTTTQAYDLLLSTTYYNGSASATSVSPTAIAQNTSFSDVSLALAWQMVPSVGLITSGLTAGGSSPGYANVAYQSAAVSSPGNDGDWYLNTATGVLWGPKIAGSWTPSAYNFLPTAGQSATNCSSNASPAACGAASAGSVVIAAVATTVNVNTTAVTAASQIFLTYDSSLSTKLGVTCNATEPALYGVTARTPATGFTITSTASITNPACFSYFIVN